MELGVFFLGMLIGIWVTVIVFITVWQKYPPMSQHLSHEENGSWSSLRDRYNV